MESHGAIKRQAAAQIMMVKSYHRVCETRFFHPAITAGGELNQHNRRDAWIEAVEYLWRTFSDRPSYLRVGGRPVLHWYVEKDVWPEWTDARWTIRRTNHFFWSARQPLDGGWGFGTDPNLPGIKECMSFWPGWDLSPPGISQTLA